MVLPYVITARTNTTVQDKSKQHQSPDLTEGKKTKTRPTQEKQHEGLKGCKHMGVLGYLKRASAYINPVYLPRVRYTAISCC